jgi:hypothetical protein
VFGAIGDAPLWLSKRVRFYLPSVPRPQSKAATVVNELTEAGVPASSIYTPPKHATSRTIRRVVRTVWRLPQALALALHARRRSSRMDAVDLRILLGRDAVQRLVRRHAHVRWIVISDISPELHMLWSGALAEEGHVFWWQDDYHHGVQGARALPYPVGSAALLNDAGYEIVCERAREAQLLRRQQPESHPIKGIPAAPRVGVALNGFFAALPEQLAWLNAIRQRLGVERLLVRLHPNSTIKQTSLNVGWLVLAPRNQSLDQYVQHVDVVVVGNSAVQLRLLQLGVPVVHVPNLDPHGFDLYGYVQSGVTAGARSIRELDISAVSRFYRKGHPIRAVELLSLRCRPHLLPLSHLASQPL